MMRLNIVTPDKKTFPIECSKNDLVKNIKKKIEASLGFLIDKQLLIHNGCALNDDSVSLDQLFVAENDEIVLFTQNKLVLYIGTNTNNRILLKIHASSLLTALQSEIEKELKISANNQLLLHNDKQIDLSRANRIKLESLSLRDGDTIWVVNLFEYSKIRIYIKKANCNKIPIEVLPIMKICDFGDLHAQMHHLFLNGQLLPTNNKTLGELGIVEENVLFAFPKQEIVMKITYENVPHFLTMPLNTNFSQLQVELQKKFTLSPAAAGSGSGTFKIQRVGGIVVDVTNPVVAVKDVVELRKENFEILIELINK